MQATLDSIYKKVLSQGGKEQSATYPPHIFDEHFNTVTQFLIDECVRVFPDNQSVVDIIKPFLITKDIPVRGGKIAFPPNYRNLLGIAINVTADYKGECTDKAKVFADDPLAPTAQQLTAKLNKPKCISNDVVMVDIDEWGYRTKSKYKYPTYQKPIGCIFMNDAIRVCPFDIGGVEMRYVRQAKVYRYGYKTNPDDTIVFDPKTTEESEWDDTAMQYLTKGVTSLYSIYLRDSEMRDWNMELKKLGIF